LLVVSDLQRSIDFYVRKLGFVDPNAHGDPPCFAMMNRDGFDLMLSLAEDRSHVRPHGAHGTWDFYMSISDLSAEMQALECAGVPLAKGPKETVYAMREIEVLDPDGYRICFGQDVGNEPLRVAEVYEGMLDLGAARLRLVLKLAPSDDGLVGRLDSPDQGAMNLPIESVTREGSALKLEMSSIGASFQGTLANGDTELNGRWSQRGREWPLVFRRV
jgi:catechol 2,3-dioxygenase-like lactoylglutathione lyase family enzyme